MGGWMDGDDAVVVSNLIKAHELLSLYSPF